ncbi:DinB family protein [Bacillus mangrovi]|uniref:DinB family protein n=1 Tax=Metabacillus mangrovi TaxID=1491830 RepID=A0A7X2S5A1_9BACI|nr:DinB family protein [Metabacillus mangrovi]MTH53662.1 DinB family protein [Metabacillus mangrovi]
MIQRPAKQDYHDYYEAYIRELPEGDLIEILENQLSEWTALTKDLSEKQSLFSYAPGKWTIKEVIGHIADTERIMAYRLLCLSRGEQREFPGYPDDSYVREAEFNRIPLSLLLENMTAVRRATITLLKSLQPDALNRRGKANGSEVTVLALAAIIAGHELHHVGVLRERYLEQG